MAMPSATALGAIYDRASDGARLGSEPRDSHILGMMTGKQHPPETSKTETITAQRDAVLRALGIDPATVVWPDSALIESCDEEAAAADQEVRLSDAEWHVIAPFLPAEPPQARAMSNRNFLDEVVRAMQRCGTWTTRQKSAQESDAVRRRFGRWAHLGVFQVLEEQLPSLDLPGKLKSALTLAAQRAESLRRRSSGRARGKSRPSVRTDRAYPDKAS
jgi:hypothetical protein